MLRKNLGGLLLGFAVVGCAETVPPPDPVHRPYLRPPAAPAVVQPIRPSGAPQFLYAPPNAMSEGVRTLWAGYPDRAGVAVMRADGTWLISHRGDEFMPQQSVSKLWVAIAVLQAIDEGRLHLNDKVIVRETDLTVFHQPIDDYIGADGLETNIDELLQQSIMASDNTANDVLSKKVGGPSGIRAMLAAKGLGAIRYGPGEVLLQSYTAGIKWRPEYRFDNNFEKARAKLTLETRQKALERYLADPIDGATPAGIARALIRLKRGELLSPESTRYLLNIMSLTGTGPQRLKAGVPAGWGFAHKTGTGQDLRGRTAGYNDVSIMTAPDGTAYAVVVMIGDTVRPIPQRQIFMQSISSMVGRSHVR